MQAAGFSAEWRPTLNAKSTRCVRAICCCAAGKVARKGAWPVPRQIFLRAFQALLLGRRPGLLSHRCASSGCAPEISPLQPGALLCAQCIGAITAAASRTLSCRAHQCSPFLRHPSSLAIRVGTLTGPADVLRTPASITTAMKTSQNRATVKSHPGCRRARPRTLRVRSRHEHDR